MVEKTRIAVLVSGGGTNLQAILDAQHAGAIPDGQVVLVVSNKKDAYALTRAENAGVKTAVVLRKKNDTAGFEARLEKVLADHGVELIVLAGFMTILSGAFTAKWPERILNVHPALIPAFCGKGFYGLRVHEAALRCGVKVTGATVHFVNEIPAGGRIVAQKAVSVLPQDTPQTLQKRVMEQAEWQILPQAVAQVCRNIRTEKERKEKMNVYQTACIGDLLKSNAYPRPRHHRRQKRRTAACRRRLFIMAAAKTAATAYFARRATM
jgi:phosphoribosylglycinamide formyltransferase-1